MVTKCPIALHLVGKSAKLIALNIHIYINVCIKNEANTKEYVRNSMQGKCYRRSAYI